ncbi:MAG TPA: LAGLIDADG family homing endonuclease [Candidatus Nanoarchaeia archaeon]|nr:LAGLIDADG family homing endonuclease [Candidatus Nanoarchaeia archaeon]
MAIKNRDNLARLNAYNLTMSFREKGLGRRKIEKILFENGFGSFSKNVSSWIYYNRKPMHIKEIKKSSSKLTENKAYILGVIGPGDGYLTKSGIALSVIDRDFAETFKLKCEIVYGITPSEYIKKPGKTTYGTNDSFTVQFFSVNLLDDLKNYNVSFREGDWRIPDQIINSNDKIKCSYISGFADSQGTPNERQITIASSNLEGMRQMLILVRSLGLRSNIQKAKNIYVLCITSRASLEYYYDKIKFCILRKQIKLSGFLANYKNTKYTTPRSEVDKMIPKMLALKKQGLTQNQIASILNIDPSVVSRRLKKLNGGE